MPIFAIIMPLVIFIILGIIYGTKPAYDGADYTFMEQSFGAVSAVAICASGLMGLPLAVSGLREMKMKNTFLGISTGSILLPICVMLVLTTVCTVLAIRFFRWE